MKTFTEWANENHVTGWKPMRDFGQMVWDAAIATQPTQKAEAPSERERRELQEVANRLREVGYHNAANNTERNIADIKSGIIPHAVIGAALAPQQPEALAQQEQKRWLCLTCKSDTPGRHGMMDDGVTPCPDAAPSSDGGDK